MLSMYAEQDDWDRHWDDCAEAAALNPAQRYRRRLVMGVLSKLGGPARLVDVGAGTGDLAAEVAAAFPEVEILGLELSSRAVEIARAKVPGATFVAGDLLEDGEPDPDHRLWATHAV